MTRTHDPNETSLIAIAPTRQKAEPGAAALRRAPVLRRVVAETIDRLVPLPFLVPLCPPWIVIVILYDLLGDTGGASVGKRLMGLRVRDAQTLKPATVRQSLLRNAGHVLLRLAYGSIVFAPIALLWDMAEAGMSLARPDGRRIGDIVAGTHVTSLEYCTSQPAKEAKP